MLRLCSFCFLLNFVILSVKARDLVIEKRYILEEINKRGSNVKCQADTDCSVGFFCKLNSCVAKRKEGGLCLSGRHEECQCNSCVLDPYQWVHMCMSEDSCYNLGITKHNSCKSYKDCPENYFCDLKDNGVCKSKLAKGNLCFDDEMCECGSCSFVMHKPRGTKATIPYGRCDAC